MTERSILCINRALVEQEEATWISGNTSLKIVWNGEEKKWEGKLIGKVMKAEYIHELVNPLGQDGWEMVGFAPEALYATGSGYMRNVISWDTSTYRAMLKRKPP